jgi:glyoxalase-like protein
MTRRELIASMAAAGAALAIQGEAAMQGLEKTKILFIAGFGPIVRDMDASRKLYAGALEIPFKEESGGYLHTSVLQGAKEFALWPLSQAAESCFGTNKWPDSVPAPHAWLEFDVDSVESATKELESRGYQMLIKNKKEPWGQTVSRFLDSDGLLIGLTFTPSMREKK